MNLDKIKKIYMIGIKGVGMTALAQFFTNKGIFVIGSDIAEKFMTDKVLKDNKIKVIENFSKNNIPKDVDLVIHSLAYKKENNEEVREASKSEKKILNYGEALGEVFNNYKGIAVAGSHGKTTVSAWLAYVMEKAGFKPNAVIGSNVNQFKGNILTGDSNYFIVEADEYGNKLRHLKPNTVLLNNIDYDHPDYFKTRDDYKKVFIDFIKRIPRNGLLVANYDDKIIRSIAGVNSLAKVISYGIEDTADYVAYDIKQVGNKQYFKVKMGLDNSEEELDESLLGDFSISLSGKHSIYNALAVIVTAIEFGVELVDIRTYLEDFSGASRRMEFMGKFREALVYDDYAHHPTEIKTTLAGVRETYPDRNLRVVFHPHTFTRTKALLEDFSKCFFDADEVIILDIYGSAREEQGGVHSRDLVAKIKGQVKDNRLKVKYISSQKECEKYLRETVSRKDFILLMGAGDVFRIGEKLTA
jgi:UDP-N-acetylmuramate--alanine ligase